MNKLMIDRLLVLCLFSMIPLALCAGDSFELKNLKVEYVETPLGIDVEKPRFSWQMEVSVNSRDYMQTAYRIIVSDEYGMQVWDSKKIKKDISLNVQYDGIPLKAATRYSWTVYAWDNKGKKASASSWFETGLMSLDHAYQGWSGAKWIGGGDDDQTLYSHYLPVYRLDFTLQLDKYSNSTRAGFIYGANDERLMNQFKNLYHLENAKDESYVMVELDVAPLISGKKALLHIYRMGYHPKDQKDIPLKSLHIPSAFINEKNQKKKHTVTLTSEYGFTRFYYLDSNGYHHRIGEVNLNPLGQGENYITFPVVGDVGYSLAEGQKVTSLDITIRHFRSPSHILRKLKFTTDSLLFRTVDPSRNSIPMLRTEFTTNESKVQKARLYVTSRGIYKMYMNGQAIDNDYFNPGLTQYNKAHLYQTFDVTACVHSGRNVIGAMLGEGWWSGGTTYAGSNWNYFGDRQSLLAKLVITYMDGTQKIVVTEPSQWTYFNDGPVLYGSLFQGEVFNALKEKQIEGWDTPVYDASSWKPAQEISLEKCMSTRFNNGWLPSDDYTGFQLIGQLGKTVKAVKELTAVSVKEVRPGVFVYDMGQNMAGVPKINLLGMKPGEKINLRFAEVTYPDLPASKKNIGMIMLENIRGAMAQDIYITKGGDEIISPRFTYHGYRYIEITGIEKPLPVEAVKGIVLSSIDTLTSDYRTSNPKVNRLWQNIFWSTYANFISIPTDCPQRNERLGWGGDISVFSRTATYLATIPQFLRRHLLAMRHGQRADGRFPDIAPFGGGFGGLLWGSAGITVAWESYQQYDDKTLLSEHYEAMKHYIHYILDKCIDPSTNVLVQEKGMRSLGDWLGLEDEKNDKTLLWESYFIRDLDLMEKMATVLNKKKDAEWYKTLSTDRRTFFCQTYLDPVSGKTIASGCNGSKKKGALIDIQTSYVLPLVFDLVPNEKKAKLTEHLIQTVVRENSTDKGKKCPSYSLMTGFIGTAWISQALSDNGYGKAAYKLLQQTDYPSWLYPIEQGATTIWERLNSYTHLDGFGGNNRMNSFNHYSFGAIGAWMCSHSLGIQRDEKFPGFKHFILKPEMDSTGEMTYAKGYYDSMYGRIESSWSKEKNGTAIYHFTVPANTTARLYLPATSIEYVRESGKLVKRSKGVKYIGIENGIVILDIVSGSYSFVVEL